MAFIFFLNYQRNRLMNKITNLKPDQKKIVESPIFDLHAKFEKDKKYMNEFNYHTRSFFDCIKSIIPGTKAYSARRRWANNISKLKSDIDYLCKLKPFKIVDVTQPQITQLPIDSKIIRLTLPTNFNNPTGMNHFEIQRAKSRSRSPSPERKSKPQKIARDESSGSSIIDTSSDEEIVLTRSPDKKTEKSQRILFYRH